MRGRLRVSNLPCVPVPSCLRYRSPSILDRSRKASAIQNRGACSWLLPRSCLNNVGNRAGRWSRQKNRRCIWPKTFGNGRFRTCRNNRPYHRYQCLLTSSYCLEVGRFQRIKGSYVHHTDPGAKSGPTPVLRSRPLLKVSMCSAVPIELTILKRLAFGSYHRASGIDGLGGSRLEVASIWTCRAGPPPAF
jgi:hypothetical protein